LVQNELLDILQLLGENIKKHKIIIKFGSKNFFLQVITKKKDILDELVKDLRDKWGQFKNKNEDRVKKKTFTTFLYNHFNNSFKFFIQKFFGLNDKSLELLIKEKISDHELFLEYNYYFSDEEIEIFENLTKEQELTKSGLYSLTGYFFFITSALGVIIRKLINEPVFVMIDCGVIKSKNDKRYLNFLVVVKNSKEKIFEYYLDMSLYYFLKPFKGIPELYHERMIQGREKLYSLALNHYPNINERLTDLLYYFYKKCKLMGNFSPLLDFINFVGPRIEDSIYSKIDLIRKEFLGNYDYSEAKKNALVKFFDFLDKKSTLYSTFQANNLPSPKSQFNLFLLYMKYFFVSGLEGLEVGDLLYLPGIFKTSLNQFYLEEKREISTASINNIGNFINYFAILSNINSFELLFKKIFGNELIQMNYEFFRTFLQSFNTKFSMLIDEENKKIHEGNQDSPFTFNIIADHICKMLYTLVEKVFLRNDPAEASENFIDPRGRYVGKNIALRVLEMFLFQDMNFSDDIWPEFIISLNKAKIRKELANHIVIPKTEFYSDGAITKFLFDYNFKSDLDELFFEEWIIHNIIFPLDNLIQNVKTKVKDTSNSIEVYEKLSEILLEGIEESDVIQDFKSACQELAPFWADCE
jgi:hypothetical protein